MRQDIDISSFIRGEGSPRLKGRTDYAAYYDMCETVLNLVVLPQGGATRCPGTLFVLASKDQGTGLFRSRLIPFVFSTIQAYQLEFTQGNVRVFMNDGVVLSGGVPVDIVVPYQAADLAAIQYTQSADTLYLCHPSYPTATLTRTSHTTWTYAAVPFLDGPYLNLNTTATTLTPAATTGSGITVTASSTVGINPTRPNDPTTGQGFLNSDIGRPLRVKVSAKWGWAIVSAVGSPTSISVNIQPGIPAPVTGNYVDGAFDGTSATANWQLGKWSATTGYPYQPMFWGNRLALCGTNNQPNAAELSCTGAFTTFSPTLDDGTTVATNALSWVLSDDQVNAIRWLSPAGNAAAQQFGIGTAAGENLLQPANLNAALSPTNVQVYRETSYGAAPNVRPLRIGKAVLFADRPGRRLREWQWAWAVNGLLGPELTADAEHITRPSPSSLPGVVELAYQQSPYSLVWARLGDGQLVGNTYLPEQKVNAWWRRRLGGQYYGGAPIVESISSIPSSDGSYDELWLAVLRTINGAPFRSIEVMTRFFDGQAQDQAWFMDCAVQSALTFPAATLTMSAASGNGAVFTASAPVFAAGDVAARTLLRVNNGLALVKTFTDTTHVVADWYVPANSTAPAAANSWSYTAQSASFSGLGHLTGETVQIIGDGADFSTQVVSGGAIALAGTASFATAGLPMPYDLVTMPFAPRQAAASVAGREKLIDHLFLRLHESLGCNFGQKRTDPMTGVVDHPKEALETRGGNDMLGQPPRLQSGVYKLPTPGGFDREGQIEISGAGPFPLTVLSIGAACDVSGAIGPPA